ncbi:hypothetical protein [Waltera sp.]|uniref:hypothetical protein n=1 Tax=Waltera sp. TaxID=2815806 RepID=UPI0039A171C5
MTPQEYRRLLEICDAKFKAYEAAGCETYALIEKTTCGRCTNTRQASLSCRRMHATA